MKLRPGESLKLYLYLDSDVATVFYTTGRGQTYEIDVEYSREGRRGFIYVRCMHGVANRARLITRLCALFPWFRQTLSDRGLGPP